MDWFGRTGRDGGDTGSVLPRGPGHLPPPVPSLARRGLVPAVRGHQARSRVGGEGRRGHEAAAGGRHGEQGQRGSGGGQTSEGGWRLAVAMTRGGEERLGLEDGGRVQVPGVEVIWGLGLRGEAGEARRHWTRGRPQTGGMARAGSREKAEHAA